MSLSTCATVLAVTTYPLSILPSLLITFPVPIEKNVQAVTGDELLLKSSNWVPSLVTAEVISIVWSEFANPSAIPIIFPESTYTLFFAPDVFQVPSLLLSPYGIDTLPLIFKVPFTWIAPLRFPSWQFEVIEPPLIVMKPLYMYTPAPRSEDLL